MVTLKEKLYQVCVEFVKKKEEGILKTIASNLEALNSETKSSAGDKHETGRAMLQLEMEKASQQLEVVSTMKATMQRIDSSETSARAKLGSLVKTDHLNYFLAISAGELKIDSIIYYAVSVNSPIGRLLLGSAVGDAIFFNKKIEIQEIL